MPRAKSLQHYPDAYQEFLEAVGVRGEIKRVPMDRSLSPNVQRTQAVSFRGHWYAFVGSLKSEARRIRELKSRSAGEEEILRLAGLQATVLCQIEDGPDGPWVCFMSRERSWQAQLLKNAETIGGESSPSSGKMDETASRLLNIQQQIDKGGKDGSNN